MGSVTTYTPPTADNDAEQYTDDEVPNGHGHHDADDSYILHSVSGLVAIQVKSRVTG